MLYSFFNKVDRNEFVNINTNGVFNYTSTRIEEQKNHLFFMRFFPTFTLNVPHAARDAN